MTSNSSGRSNAPRVAVGGREPHAHAVAGRDLLVAELDVAGAVRAKHATGDVHRRISSTAVPSSDGSRRKRSHWSGWSRNATRPPEIAERVVSDPAMVRIRKNWSSSDGVSRHVSPSSPSTSAVVRMLHTSSVGIAALVLAERARVLVELHAGEEVVLLRDARLRIGRGHDRVGPAEHVGAVGLGDAHDVGDHVHRELVGDVLHEVAGARLGGGVEHAGGARRDLLVEPAGSCAGVKPELMSLRMRVWLGGSADTRVWPRCSSPVGEMLAPSSELNVCQSRASACSSG